MSIENALTKIRVQRVHELVEGLEAECKIYDDELKFALIRGAIRSDWILDGLVQYSKASVAEKPDILGGLFRLVKLLEMA